MYLRKIEGPRTVELPDGTHISRSDLPPPDTKRWVATRKAAVVMGVAAGLVTRDWAIRTYDLSGEEFDAWVEAAGRHGVPALRATAVQDYRRPLPKDEQL